MESPTVAVLMSTYQGETYLREQIDSILAQKNVTVSLWVRDDGSTDQTCKILQEYQALGQLHYITEKNIGYRKSFMSLCKSAPIADYYAFSDQDDIWFPEKLSDAIGELIKYNDTPALYSCDFFVVNENLCTTKSTVHAHLCDEDLYKNSTLQQQIKTGCVLNDIGGFGCTQVWNNHLHHIIKECPVPTIPIDHDTILGMVAILCGKYLPSKKKAVQYRQHGKNTSGNHIGITYIRNQFLFHLKRLFGKAGPKISECNKEMASCYGTFFPTQSHMIINKTIRYQESIRNRLQFAMSDYPKLLSGNKRLKFFLKVIMGKY